MQDVKIPVRDIQDQVRTYSTIQKSTTTDKIGVIYGRSNFLQFCPSIFGQLWPQITFDTGARGGQIGHGMKGLEKLYKGPKTRTYSSKLWTVAAHLNLAKIKKTRTFFEWNLPKSSPGVNFKRATLRGFLTVLLETNAGHQSYTYLQMTITEFFCNCPVIL